MPKFLILNASPRENGTAHMLCMRLQQSLAGDYMSLYQKPHSLESLLLKIKQADTIVLVGPCYVNTFPGQVTELFEYLADHTKELQGKVWYGIIEGGMPYTHTHQSGLKHLEYFCKSCGMSYNGGFMITIAPLLNGQPLEKHKMAKKILPAFEQFTNAIKTKSVSPDSLYENLEGKMSLIFTKCFAFFMSHMTDKQIKANGFDPKQKSPYC